MTKTEHYQLPQWEGHDPVCREDFNAANQAIDTALATINTNSAQYGYEFASVYTSNMAVGSTVYTFTRAPKFVILFTTSYGAPVLVQSNGLATLLSKQSYDSDYLVTFQLSGKALILSARTNTAAASNLKIVGFY